MMPSRNGTIILRIISAKNGNLHNERDGYSYRPVFFFPLQGEGMDKNGNNYLY